LVIYLIIWVFILGLLTSNGMAMLIPSILPEARSNSITQREGELQKIQVLLESKLISQRLSDLGLTVLEVQERLAQLPDEQIHQIVQQLDSLQPGGDSALGIIIALLVIAILVVILLHITGHKIIVTK
jgi:Flp pilus assembly protein TadB